MRRSGLGVAALVLASMTAFSACTSADPRGGAATASGPTSSTASAGVGAEPGLADGDARAITADVDRRERQALGAGSASGAEAAESGSLLQLTLGQFTYDRHRHRSPAKPSLLTIDTMQVPPAGAASPSWFEVSAWDSVGAEFASLYERSGGTWRKTMQVPLSYGTFPKWDVSDSVATPATPAQTLQAQQAMGGLARYLATGKRPHSLIVSPSAQDLRDHMRVNTASKSWRTSSVRCVSRAPKAVIQSKFGVSYLGDIYCGLAWSTKPGFTTFLKGAWKDLPSRSDGLVAVDDHIVVEVAATTLPNGQVTLTGLDWNDVRMEVR